MDNTITLTELVGQLQEKLPNTVDSGKFIEAFVSTIIDGLTIDNEVTINGLGTFFLVKSESLSGNTKDNIRFIPDSELADTVNQPFAFFDAVELDDDVTDTILNEQDSETQDNEPEPTEPGNNDTDSEDTSAEINDETSNADNNTIYVTENDNLIDVIDEAKDDTGTECSEDTNTEYTYSETDTENHNDNPVYVIDETKENDDTDSSEDTDTENPDEESVSEQSTPDNDYTDDNISDTSDDNSSDDDTFNDNDDDNGNDKSWLWLLLFFIIGLAIGWSVPTFITNRNTTEEIILHDTIYLEKTIMAKDTVKPVEKTPEQTTVVTDTVKPNRFLTTMARQHYGNAEFWAYIYIENGEKKLGDPNKIQPGIVVVIPPAEKYGIDAKSRASVDLATKKCKEILDKYKSN